jgi:hypothetical protein
MEARLKEDILREAERYDGAIMVIHETDNGVYKRLDSEGLPIKYARVPITDGKAPKSSDFDTVAMNVAAACKDAALVFNCQVLQLISLLGNNSTFVIKKTYILTLWS